MVVHDLHVLGPGGGPSEADPPLVVDPNAVLPFAIALQRLQAVLRGRGEIAEMLGRINQAEPAVVGIDAFFRAPKDEDPVSDSALSAAMQATPNLVLVSKVAFKEEAEEGVVEQWVTSTVDADRVFDTLEDEFHGIHGVHRLEDTTRNEDALEIFLFHKQVFFSCA